MLSPDRTNPTTLVSDVERAARRAAAFRWVFAEAVAAGLGLNKTDLECLDIVVAGPDVSAGSLAEATGLTTGAITGVIDRLVARGYATRQGDPRDRRRVIIRPTATALDAAARLYRPFGDAMGRLLTSYGSAELALLLGYLERSADVALAAIEELRLVMAADATPAPASDPVGAEKLRELAA